MLNHVLAIFLGGLPILCIQIIFMVYVCRKRHYKQIPCKACGESGQVVFRGSSMELWKIAIMYESGALEKPFFTIPCKKCRGRGTQTVLDRIE